MARPSDETQRTSEREAKLPKTPNEKLKYLNFDDKSKKLSMRSVAQLPLRINFK